MGAREPNLKREQLARRNEFEAQYLLAEHLYLPCTNCTELAKTAPEARDTKAHGEPSLLHRGA